MITRDDALALDAADPLRHTRDRFVLPAGVIYMDGNSLGPVGVGVRDRVTAVIDVEWGRDLITSWTMNGWLTMPQRVGDRIGALIGAAAGQVIVGDSTSVNLFKLLVAGARMRPGRRVVVTEASNFPSDLYLIESVAETMGLTVRRVTSDDLIATIDESVALVSLTHVNYQNGAMLDMAGITAAAHDVGAMVLWDLSHSAGAMPVELDALNVDLAVGCTYKFLNGGPGAPAYSYVAARHQASLRQPLTGWLGHVDPFAMSGSYEPAPDITRALVGTPMILSLVALDAALDAFDAVSLGELRRKSQVLCDLFIGLVEHRCAGLGIETVSPREPDRRGSQVCFRHDQARRLIELLTADGVFGDYREPRIARFGVAPLTLRYIDVWEATGRMQDALRNLGKS